MAASVVHVSVVGDQSAAVLTAEADRVHVGRRAAADEQHVPIGKHRQVVLRAALGHRRDGRRSAKAGSCR
jgi:hypothetical protein